MHYHGYLWQGSGEERQFRVSETYPEHPDFGLSPLPPQRVCWWLLKPASMVEGTWESPGEAVAWLADRYAAVFPRIRTDRPEWYAPRARQGFWMDSLEQGTDLVCAHWLQGGEGFTAAVVCCPNRWEELPCPVTGAPAPPAERM